MARLVCIILSALIAVALPCSSGCTSKSTAEAKKELEKLKNKKPEKPKPPFDQLKVFTEPNEKSFTEPKDAENQTIVRNAIKPGHWTGVLVEAKANNFDFGGEMISEPRDNQSNLVSLESSPFTLVMSRPAALAKGQKKTLEAIFFASPSNRLGLPSDPSDFAALRLAEPSAHRTSTWIYNQLRSRQSGIESRGDTDLLQHMPDYQYYMFVLARDASRYRYLKVLDSVRPLSPASTIIAEDACYYRVLFPRTNQGQPLALPTQPLCWTSVAYVVWDDVLPSVLTPEQQRAMLDWLHWGGGLIVSGPQTLDALRGTFLEPYLPASAERTMEIDSQSLAELNQHWTIPDTQNRRTTLEPVEPWSGVKLAKHPAADFLSGTGEMVVERRVGRGRIVATAFRLSEHELLNWRSFDSFFNACILRHPRRQFNFTHNSFEFAAPGVGRLDPELVSNVRFFTRDAKGVAHRTKGSGADETAASTMPGAAADSPNSDYLVDSNAESSQIESLKSRPGVAAWNDFSRVSAAAGQALRAAAGIAVPKRQFVLWMVGIYLVLIVPVNWLVFRLLGRVEWAWIAVPLVALAWGAVVIWLAQLDIGFARAETEVAVLEMQGDFPRAHLTRYTALYSSLSTSYSVHFDDPTAVAQPFAVDLRLLQGQARSTVTLRNVGENQLTDYMVSSNSTGMVHSEQMFDLEGSLVWNAPSDETPSLENNTKLKLSGVTIVRRRWDEGQHLVDESAWLGNLLSGAKVDVTFEPHDPQSHAAARDRDPLTTKDRPEGGLSLRRLVDFAEDHQSLAPGEVRLVGWRDERLKSDKGLQGVRIEPAASQSRRATLVVANLQFGELAAPARDLNLRNQADPVAEPAPAESNVKQ